MREVGLSVNKPTLLIIMLLIKSGPGPVSFMPLMLMVKAEFLCQ